MQEKSSNFPIFEAYEKLINIQFHLVGYIMLHKLPAYNTIYKILFVQKSN